jgi:hypothetical protein
MMVPKYRYGVVMTVSLMTVVVVTWFDRLHKPILCLGTVHLLDLYRERKLELNRQK